MIIPSGKLQYLFFKSPVSHFYYPASLLTTQLLVKSFPAILLLLVTEQFDSITILSLTTANKATKWLNPDFMSSLPRKACYIVKSVLWQPYLSCYADSAHINFSATSVTLIKNKKKNQHRRQRSLNRVHKCGKHSKNHTFQTNDSAAHSVTRGH